VTIEPGAARSRTAVASVFVVNGLVLASWVPHIPVVKAAHGLDDARLGAILLCMAAGAVSSLSLAGWLVTVFGSRRTTIVAAVGLCAALPLPVLAPSPEALALSLLVLGGCNGLLDVSMNAQAVEVEALCGRPILSGLHGLFSLGGLSGAAAAAALAWLGVAPLHHVAATAVVTLTVVAFASASLVPTTIASAEHAPLFVRPTGSLRSFGLLAFAALLAEGAMADWSAVYLRDSLGSSMHVAAIGFAAFSLTMSLARLSGDQVVRRLGAPAVLRASGVVAAGGLGVALLLGHPAAAIAGCATVGLGIANVFPILLSQAGRLPDIEPGRALAAVTATGYCGFLAGPPLIGLAAEWISLPAALAVVVVFCSLVAVVPLPGGRDAV